MKAKKVYESSVFKAKTEEEIHDELNSIDPRDALILSINMGNLEGVKNAIERGADIDLVTFYNLTPLDLAFRKGNDDITDFLVSMGARTRREVSPKVYKLNQIVGNGDSYKISDSHKIRESVNDIFKPKSKEELEKSAREYARIDDIEEFPVKIPKKTLGGEDVYLVSKTNVNDMSFPYPWLDNNEIFVSGFLHTIDENGIPEWKFPSWRLNGVMVSKYSWYNENMDLKDEVTKEELDKLPKENL